MKQQGKIKFFKRDRGYGFITPNNGGPDALLHVSVCERAGYLPEQGDDVTFDAEQGRNGMKATWVEKVG